jgi:hypothetical protein
MLALMEIVQNTVGQMTVVLRGMVLPMVFLTLAMILLEILCKINGKEYNIFL